MPNAPCARCGDPTGREPWWAMHDGKKVPVCLYCSEQLRSHPGMPQQEWDDEPIHKAMDRERR